MNLNKYLLFLAWIHAMSKKITGRSKLTESICLMLSPANLDNEIDLLISAILSEVKAAFWEELYLNPRHEAANLKVAVEIRSDSFFRGYVLSSPPSSNDVDTLNARFFKETASFAETLKGDLCYAIMKKEISPMNPAPLEDAERRDFRL